MFFDDWSACIPTTAGWEQVFLRALDEFLSLLQREGVILKATKTEIGFETGTFYGFELRADGGNAVKEEFVRALRERTAPSSIQEVRSLLGTLNVARDYIPNYAIIASPITELLRGKKGAKRKAIKWTQACDHAMEELLELLTNHVLHYAPDDTYPLHLATDASDDGCGAHCFQLLPARVTGLKTAEDAAPSTLYTRDGTLVPNSSYGTVELDACYVRRTIAFFSKCWDHAMRARPVFYREASAALQFLAKIKILAMTNHYPVQVWVDQVSLRWVKHNNKGQVTTFLLDELADVNYEIAYRSGVSNTMSVPDSLSRYPMLGPRRWASAGLEGFYKLLFDEIGSTVSSASKLWVYAGQDTTKLRKRVRDDVGGAVIVETAPSTSPYPKADVAIVAPAPDKAVEICARMLSAGIAGACLVPSDLIQRVPETHSGGVDADLASKLLSTVYVGSLGSDFMWVVMGIPTARHAVVAMAASSPPNVLDTKEWIGKQQGILDDSEESWTDKDGLLHMMHADGRPRIIVPDFARTELIRTTHADAVGHLGLPQTIAELRRRFFWPSMWKQVKEEVERCDECAHTKGSRRLAHKQFRGSRYSGPRTAYRMDTKQFGTGGHALALVDAFDSYTILIPMRSRTQGEVMDSLIDEVFLVYGFPVEIRTDNAKEFGQRLRETLAKFGVKLTYTEGYHAQGNAHVERIWPMVKACFRRNATLLEWRRDLRMVAFALNTGIRELHGLSPFEVQFGLPAITALHASTVSGVDMDYEPQARELDLLLSMARANIATVRSAGDYYRRHQAEKANEDGGAKKPVVFEVGALVMIFREPKGITTTFYEKPADFVPKWIGPWMVLHRRNTVYTLQATWSGHGMTKGEVVHRSVMNIKPYRGKVLEDLLNKKSEEARPEMFAERFTTTVEVTVPVAWSPGQQLEFRFAGKSWLVDVPPGTTRNSTFRASVYIDEDLEPKVEGGRTVDLSLSPPTTDQSSEEVGGGSTHDGGDDNDQPVDAALEPVLKADTRSSAVDVGTSSSPQPTKSGASAEVEEKVSAEETSQQRRRPGPKQRPPARRSRRQRRKPKRFRD